MPAARQAAVPALVSGRQRHAEVHTSCSRTHIAPPPAHSLELNLERDLAAFCSQDCFKASWAEHKKLHKPSIEGWHYCTRRGQGRALNMPDFKWTGDLRPARIGPMRHVS